MTVKQFKAVHDCIPTEIGKVMSRLTVATGMRFGEITALTDNLLFPQRPLIPMTASARKRPPLTPERIIELGTFAAANGRTYRHGTVNGYATGKCRCDGCRQASSEYSVKRRAARRGKSAPAAATRPEDRPSANTTGHCGRHDWGHVWKTAVKRSGIGMAPTAYQLRHTHASWLIEAGEDPKTVMKRLGHHNLATFSLYVHTVEENDDVLDTMSNLLGDLG